MIKKALSFDKIATLYDKSRANYPNEVYETIRKYLPDNRKATILEIGGGSGIASTEILRFFNADLIIVEPGLEFIPLLRNKFKKKSNVIIINKKFEDLNYENRFDCVISATAFHWIAPKRKYSIAVKALVQRGVIALFWNNYTRSDERIFDEIETVYVRHHPDVSRLEDIRIKQKKEIDSRKKDFLATDQFKILEYKIIQHQKTYNTEEYIGLLKSFSDNSTKRPGDLATFYKEMKKLLNDNGGKLDLPIIVDLIIGEKLI